MSQTCHPDAILGLPSEEAYRHLQVITLDGGDYRPDRYYAWCGVCGSFWSPPPLYGSGDGSWEAPTRVGALEVNRDPPDTLGVFVEPDLDGGGKHVSLRHLAGPGHDSGDLRLPQMTRDEARSLGATLFVAGETIRERSR